LGAEHTPERTTASTAATHAPVSQPPPPTPTEDKSEDKPASIPPPAPYTPPPPRVKTPKATKADPLQNLQQVYAARDPQIVVDARVEKARVSIDDQDELRWSIRSASSGYLYVLYVGTDKDFLML